MEELKLVESKQKNSVPKLRYAEFFEEWQSFPFGKITQRKKEKFNPITSSVSFSCIELECLSQDSGRLLYTFNSKDQKSIKNIFKEGDILFGKLRPYLRKFYKAEFNGVCSSEIWVLSGKKVSNDYLFYLLQTERFSFEINLTSGSKMPRADWDYISITKYYIPSTQEQQKIAFFLSSVDQKLELLERKKASLEAYKKGVMQKIFSREIRFKDERGKEYPEWEVKSLGEITRIYDGTHQTPKYVEKGIPFYSVEHLTSNQFSQTKYISEEVFEKENQKVSLEKGDILLTRIGDIGTSKLIYWDVRASFYVSLALIKATKHFNGAFLSQFLKSTFFQKELWKRTIHVAFPKKINLGEISNCVVKLPSSDEQRKIAEFLEAIDNKLDIIHEQLAQTKEFKKGLLQQMFV